MLRKILIAACISGSASNSMVRKVIKELSVDSGGLIHEGPSGSSMSVAETTTTTTATTDHKGPGWELQVPAGVPMARVVVGYFMDADVCGNNSDFYTRVTHDFTSGTACFGKTVCIFMGRVPTPNGKVSIKGYSRSSKHCPKKLFHVMMLCGDIDFERDPAPAIANSTLLKAAIVAEVKTLTKEAEAAMANETEAAKAAMAKEAEAAKAKKTSTVEANGANPTTTTTTTAWIHVDPNVKSVKREHCGNKPYLEFWFGNTLPSYANAHGILDLGEGYGEKQVGDLKYGWNCGGDINVYKNKNLFNMSREGAFTWFDKHNTCA